MQRWVATNVTTSPKVQQELKDFFLQHGVQQVAMSQGNMGCPHEEGEDFPLGEDCPFCPFWKRNKEATKRSDLCQNHGNSGYSPLEKSPSYPCQEHSRTKWTPRPWN
jgi:hypothetical protein